MTNEELIADLRDENKRLRQGLPPQAVAVAKVIVTEGDQYGTWQRIGNISHINETPEGLIIWIS